jgi:chaperonin GroES
VPRSFHPIEDRIVVKPVVHDEEVIKGGLVLPETAREKPQEGEVIAVGPGRRSDDGSRIELDVKVGDIVVYSKFGGTEIKEDDEDYLVLRQSDVLARLS